MDWWQILLYLALGFVLLDKGSDWLVLGGSRLARMIGLPPLVIGLTVVAWGTSLPELVVSGIAAAKGSPEMALGNVIGSDVANIGLVLGASALVLPRILHGRLPVRDAFWLLGSLAVFGGVLLDGEVARWEAAVMLVLFGAYTLFALRDRGRADAIEEEDDRHPYVHVLLGMAAIAGGAWLATTGGREGAMKLGVPPRVVGLTVLAIGTSLPELVTSLKGALRGESQIALGNVVGSNVFNTLAVLGVVGLIQPLSSGEPGSLAAEGFAKVLRVDLPVAAAFSVAMLVLPALARDRAGRVKAAALLVGVLGYFAWLYVAGRVPA